MAAASDELVKMAACWPFHDSLSAAMTSASHEEGGKVTG